MAGLEGPEVDVVQAGDVREGDLEALVCRTGGRHDLPEQVVAQGGGPFGEECLRRVLLPALFAAGDTRCRLNEPLSPEPAG